MSQPLGTNDSPFKFYILYSNLRFSILLYLIFMALAKRLNRGMRQLMGGVVASSGQSLS